MKIEYRLAQFTISAATPSQLPPDEGREVAFVGRSNSGKSSALNTLTEQKGLARTSKTPGRTQLINFFNLTPSLRLVDLPGYGYAKAPLSEQQRWIRLIHSYLEKRDSLAGLVVLMDIRHPLTSFDLQLIEWAQSRNLPLHILLSKADKLPFGKQKTTLLQVQKALQDYPNTTLQLFSSLKKIGLDELKAQLASWFTSKIS